MKFSTLNIDGSKSETVEVSDKLVKLKVNINYQVCNWLAIKSFKT